jgi:hypothetical protein
VLILSTLPADIRRFTMLQNTAPAPAGFVCEEIHKMLVLPRSFGHNSGDWTRPQTVSMATSFITVR